MDGARVGSQNIHKFLVGLWLLVLVSLEYLMKLELKPSSATSAGSSFADPPSDSSLRVLEVMGALVGQQTTDNRPLTKDILLKMGEEVKSGRKLRESFASLNSSDQDSLRNQIGRQALAELLAISREEDAELFSEALLHFGTRLKGRGRLEEAAAVLGMLAVPDPLTPAPLPAGERESVRRRAEEEYDAIIGKGSVGLRMEVLGLRLAKESLDWRVIVPMVGASALGATVGTSYLSRLVARPAGFFTRGLVARFRAGAVGFLPEFPAFAAMNRALHPGDASTSFLEDLHRSALSLGAIKFFGGVGNQIARKFQIQNEFAKFSLSQSFIFGGMLASHKLEQKVGLLKPMDDDTMVTDILGSMINLGIGSHLGHRALGQKFAAYQKELHLRAELYSRGESPEGGSRRNTLRNPFLWPAWGMLSVGGGFGGGPIGGRTRAGTSLPSTYIQEMQQRLNSIAPPTILEVESIFCHEWDRWEGRDQMDPAVQARIEAFLPHYARHALAHLGRETPPQLPFIPEAFEMAMEAYRAAQPSPELQWSYTDRVQFIRFLVMQEGRREAAIGNGAKFLEPIDLLPVPISGTPFDLPIEGENWFQFLTRLGFTTSNIVPKNWWRAGATVMTWGSKLDSENRLNPVGDIRDLLGLMYLHSNIDPYEAARLTLPEQLAHFRPNENGEVAIYYPELMKDLDYAHFGLGSLLKAYRRTHSEAHDIDIANQWGRSLSTASEYLQGTTRKMQIETLHDLAKGLLPPEPTYEQIARVLNLLMFLRYRIYFDPTMVIEDNEGSFLNHRPAHPSRVRIVLVPEGEELRPLDLRRRIHFEREPFASAINGTVDLAINLLETRRREFSILDYSHLDLPEGEMSLASLSERILEFREQHGNYFQLLSEHERSPGVVRPGQLKEIREFYRSVFRFFEAVHLHARPQGELRLGEKTLPYEIVPMTVEQPTGVRILPDPQNPGQSRAYVVAADLLESQPHLPPSVLKEIVQIRAMQAWLHHLHLLPGGDIYRTINRQLLIQAMEANEVFLSPAGVEEFFRIESALGSGSVTVLDPSTEAILHRLTRGRHGRTAAQRRLYDWSQDLSAYLFRHSVDPKLVPFLERFFQDYLEKVKQPFLRFDPDAFREVMERMRGQIEPSTIQEVRQHLLNFMKGISLPAAVATAPLDPRLTAEGLAQVALASYLDRFRTLHPFRWSGQVIEDAKLLERVVDDRLVDFPFLSAHRSRILSDLQKRIAEYNEREPLMRVFELAAKELPDPAKLHFTKLGESYEAVMWRFQAERRLQDAIHPHWVFASFGELRGSLLEGRMPTGEEINQALDRGREHLESVGMSVDIAGLGTHREFLEKFTQELYAQISAIDHLTDLWPPFVAANRFHSGLEAVPQITQEVQEVFRRHFRSAILDWTPLPLEKSILQVIGPRFDPYSSIREDVIRGITVIYQQGLEHLKGQYRQIEDALEMSFEEAKQHRSKERFWQEFLTLASARDPAVKDRDGLEQRIKDLEVFLELLSQVPEEKVSDRLRKALKELESLPPPPSEPEGGKPPSEPLPPPAAPTDPKAILAAPVSPKYLEKYPELEGVREGAVLWQIQNAEGGGRNLATVESRSLLQLLALFDQYGDHLPPKLREEIEALTLEVKTSNEASWEKLTRKAFVAYDSFQEEFLSHFPILKRISFYPEIRGSNRQLGEWEAGRAVQFLISQRKLPRELQGELEKIIEVTMPSVPNAGQIPTGLLTPYLNCLGEFYLEHREKILQSPIIELPEEYLKPLDLNNPPPRFREWIVKEAPELDVFSDKQMSQYLLKNPIGGPEVMANYLIIKVNHLFTALGQIQPNSSMGKIGAEFNKINQRSLAMKDAGASEPHVRAWYLQRMMALYQRHRPVILDYLIEKVGIEKVMATLPELRDQTIKPIVVPTKSGEVKIPRLEGYETVAKVLNRLLSLPKKQRKEVEGILDLPLLRMADTADYEKILRPAIHRILRYYLKHRHELKDLAQEPDEIASLKVANAEKLDQFWELRAIAPEDMRERRNDIELVLSDYRPLESQFVLTYQSPQGMQKERLISTAKQEEIQKAFNAGKTYQLPGEPPVEISSGMYTHSTPLTPDYLNTLVLSRLVSQPMFSYLGFVDKLETKLKNEYADNLSQAATLLCLGVDEKWVVPRFEARALQIYQRGRQLVLDQLRFAPNVREFPEIKAVPEDKVKAAWKDNPPSSLLQDPNADLVGRISAIMNQGSEGNLLKNPGRWSSSLVEKYRQACRGGGRNRPKGERAEDLARFYLQNLEEIRAGLRPWEEMGKESQGQRPSPDVLTKVMELPEMSDLKDKVKIDGVFLYQRILQILLKAKKPELEKAFTEAIQPATTEDMHLWAAEFYLKHREEIRGTEKLKADEGSTSLQDLIKEASTYKELKEIDSEEVRRVKKKSRRGKTNPSFKHPFYDSFVRMTLLLSKDWVPRHLAEPFSNLMRRGRDPELSFKMIFEYYKEHREEILSHRPSPEVSERYEDVSKKLLKEVGGYSEIQEVDPQKVKEDIESMRSQGIDIYPGVEAFLKIGILILEKWFPAELRESYERECEEIIDQNPRDLRAAIRFSLEFYQAHRDEIMAARKRHFN